PRPRRRFHPRARRPRGRRRRSARDREGTGVARRNDVMKRLLIIAALLVTAVSGPRAAQQTGAARGTGAPALNDMRPFGTLREQADMQQQWLKKRLDTFLPPLMRKYGIDLWVVPMREYNEDPVFSAIVAPDTFAARRRTIYVFFDKCAAANRPT